MFFQKETKINVDEEDGGIEIKEDGGDGGKGGKGGKGRSEHKENEGPRR